MIKLEVVMVTDLEDDINSFMQI